MTVVSVILGVLLVVCGFFIMDSPLLSFLGVATLVAIALLIWGIMGLVRGVSTKKYGFPFVLSIIGIILGFLIMVSPATEFVTDMLILFFSAAFMIIRGIVLVIVSIQSAKQSTSKMWILGIIFGILAVILGGICFAYPLLQAAVIGILIGFFFIFAGIDLIFSGFPGDRGDAAAA